jgi:hypothetical protein
VISPNPFTSKLQNRWRLPAEALLTAWDLGKTNLLKWTEDLTNAAWVRSGTSVAADAIAAPDGTLTADKLVEDSTNAQHSDYQAFSNAPIGSVMTFSVYAKDAGRRYFTLYPQNTGLAGYMSFDLVAGTTSLLFGGAQYLGSSIFPVGSGWYRCSVTFTATVATVFNVVYLSTPGGAAGITIAYPGDGISGVYFWGWQLELGTGVSTYQKVTDGQIIPNSVPAAPSLTLQLGATSGSDASDPTVYMETSVKGGKTPVSGFATSQYMLSPTIPQLSMSADWTVYLCGKFDGTLTNSGVLSIADPTSATVYQWVACHGTGVLFTASQSGGASGDIAVPTTFYCVIKLQRSGTTLILTRLDTGSSTSVVSNPLAGVPRIGLAAMVRSTVGNIIDSMKLALPALVYTRATNAFEDQRVYRWYKGQVGQTGIPTPALNVRSYSGAGTLNFSGAAALLKIKNYLGSGLLTFAGASVNVKVKVYAGSGGFAFSGTAPRSRSRAYPTGTAPFAFSGTAAKLKVKSYRGSGVLTFAGTAARVKVRGYLGGGWLHLYGFAWTTSYQPGVYKNLQKRAVPRATLTLVKHP